jgi:hypothetical protein
MIQGGIDEFVRLLFGHTRGGPHYICIFTGARNGDGLATVRERFFSWPAETEAAVRYALAQDRANREVYFCTHLLSAKQRRREHAAPISCLWSDVDDGDLSKGPAPSLVFETSPKRYHGYWLLTESIDPKRAEEMNKRLAEAIDADPSGCDLTQVLRVPLTHNYKPQATMDGAPFGVRSVRVEPEVRYDVVELDALLPATSEVRRRTPESPKPINKGERNVMLASIAGSLRRTGLDADELAATLRAINEKRCKPPLPDAEVKRIADSIARYPADARGRTPAEKYRLFAASKGVPS